MVELIVTINLTNEEKDLLRKTLNCSRDDELIKSLARITEAAGTEILG